MLRYLLVFVVVVLGVHGKAYAFCQPGDERVCFVNGEQGVQVCLDNNQFGPCSVSRPPPPPPPPVPAPPPPGVVAFSDLPNGLVASTGNLYWTNNSPAGETGTPGVSAVLRTAKTSVPGNEIVLYSEQHTPTMNIVFGDIVFANAGGFFGYFTATYINTDGSSASEIKRIPLSGGAAVVLARLPAQATALSLWTDGTSLFWSDIAGIRRMQITGGAITKLVASPNISLAVPDSGGNIIFVVGNGGVRKVSTFAGDAVVSLFDTTNKITVLYATPTQLYWGTGAGAVHSRPNAISGVDTEYQPALGARPVVSVGFDGTRVLWADCGAPGNFDCIVRKREPGASTNTIVQNIGRVGISHLQWDASSMYWHDLSTVRRFVH